MFRGLRLVGAVELACVRIVTLHVAEHTHRRLRRRWPANLPPDHHPADPQLERSNTTRE
jgi:hypothetical protein